MDEEPNLEAGLQSVTFKIVGPYAYGYMQSEIGVHRLVRMSPFGSGDTRQTSFAAVDVLPELPDDIEIVIKDGDLEWQHFSTGGPGGQHQNKTQSGARVIHKPTGVRAESRADKSQHKNKDNALKLLKARLYAIEEQKRIGDMVQALRREGRNRVRLADPQLRHAAVHARARGARRDRREDAGRQGRARRRLRPVHARLPAAQDREGEQGEEEVRSSRTMNAEEDTIQTEDRVQINLLS